MPQAPDRPSRRASEDSDALQFTDARELAAFLAVQHTHPHAFLGMHPFTHYGAGGVVIRAFLANTTACQVLCIQTQQAYALHLLHPSGFFEGFIPQRCSVFPYQLRITDTKGAVRDVYDPYAFLPMVSDQQLAWIQAGVAYQPNDAHLPPGEVPYAIYTTLGAHPRAVDVANNRVEGVVFAVWAPNAKRVSVVGDFNNWDGRYHTMRALGGSGVWELFIPGLGKGTLYKYELTAFNGYLALKSDPYALFYESPPHNASIVWESNPYQWQDAAWMHKRSQINWQSAPLSVYEVHLGSWQRKIEEGRRPLSYREHADALANYVKEMGFTHVEFMPLAEHPFDGSWGYQVTGFFAPTQRYGVPEDFMYLVDKLHQKGIGVIVDWVPAHFPRDSFALADFDGTQLYEHADPRQGQHNDWGTLIFNYGRNEVKAFLIGSALAWADRFHIDGFRVDAVASMLYLDYSRKDGEWLPNTYGGKENLEAIEFLRATNVALHTYYPGILTIAEESTAFGSVTKPVEAYGLGFDFKWDMGWMHDMTRYCNQDPLYRKHHHTDLTFGMLYHYSERFIKVFSHDEVVHGKGSMVLKMGSYEWADKFHTLRALYAYMWLWPGKKTLFMGSEFGQVAEWRHDQSLDWHFLNDPLHAGVQALVRDLNRLYQAHPYLAAYDTQPGGFEWIEPNDWAHSVVSFIRICPESTQTFLVAANFTPVTRWNYRVGVPHSGQWEEALNTASYHYAGTNSGNHGKQTAEAIPYHNKPYSLSLCLPGLSTVVFRFTEGHNI